MLCSFLKFIEEIEGKNISSPQHEVGEESLSLNKVIEKRIKELLIEFKTKRKATEEEVLASIEYNLKKMANSKDSQFSTSQPNKQTQNSLQITQGTNPQVNAPTP